MSFWNSRIFKSIIALLVLSALALALPHMGFLLVLVGLRGLAKLYWSLPVLAEVVLLTGFFVLLLAPLKSDILRVTLAAVCTWAVVFQPPKILNKQIVAEASERILQDHGSIEKFEAIDTLAITKQAWRGHKADTRCNEICIKLLLSGSVENFMILPVDGKEDIFKVETPAVVYKMVHQIGCRSLAIADEDNRKLFIQREEQDHGKPLLLSELLNLRAEAGDCLASETGSISNANLIIDRNSTPAPTELLDAGFSLFANTTSQSTLRLFIKDSETGTFRESYKKTTVGYYLFKDALAPKLYTGEMFVFVMGWARLGQSINPQPSQTTSEDEEIFYLDQIGLRLTPTLRGP